MLEPWSTHPPIVSDVVKERLVMDILLSERDTVRPVEQYPQLVLSYEPPDEAPTTGSEWPEWCDWPKIVARVIIRPQAWMMAENTDIAPLVWGEPVRLLSAHGEFCLTWGTVDDTWQKEVLFRRATLLEAEAAAMSWYEEGKAAYDAAAARVARLELRAERIRQAHAMAGTVLPWKE